VAADDARLPARSSVKKVLDHLGLPATGPPIAKVRHSVQLDFGS